MYHSETLVKGNRYIAKKAFQTIAASDVQPANAKCLGREQHRLARTLASSAYGRKPGNTAASSRRDSVSWHTPALEFLHIVWTKREMTHREKLVWRAKQKSPGAEEPA